MTIQMTIRTTQAGTLMRKRPKTRCLSMRLREMMRDNPLYEYAIGYQVKIEEIFLLYRHLSMEIVQSLARRPSRIRQAP